MNLILPRRRFLCGMASLLAAPVVVRSGLLMPISSPKLHLDWSKSAFGDGYFIPTTNTAIMFRNILIVAGLEVDETSIKEWAEFCDQAGRSIARAA